MTVVSVIGFSFSNNETVIAQEATVENNIINENELDDFFLETSALTNSLGGKVNKVATGQKGCTKMVTYSGSRRANVNGISELVGRIVYNGQTMFCLNPKNILDGYNCQENYGPVTQINLGGSTKEIAKILAAYYSSDQSYDLYVEAQVKVWQALGYSVSGVDTSGITITR